MNYVSFAVNLLIPHIEAEGLQLIQLREDTYKRIGCPSTIELLKIDYIKWILENIPRDELRVITSTSESAIKIASYLSQFNLCRADKSWCQNFPYNKTMYSNSDATLDCVKKINPYWIFESRTMKPKPDVGLKVEVDIAPKNNKYIAINGVPFCTWVPIGVSIRSYSDIEYTVTDNIVIIDKMCQKLIMTESRARHINREFGERLQINLKTGECTRQIGVMNNKGFSSLYCVFDKGVGLWTTVNKECITGIIGVRDLK